ncbi:MAG TPA: enolase C-terminal domain-like protein [Limnochordia bacterium]|nr:enolase C-terminal domain-like protein [Limnochordia bacterium]
MKRDVRPVGAELTFIGVPTRVPLKFGAEVLTEVICARVRLAVAERNGARAEGWGETPLSVQWVWPSAIPFGERQEALLDLTRRLAEAWAGFDHYGHALEVGHDFIEQRLPQVLAEANAARAGREPIPHLAALVCCSPFDIALHDAYGRLLQRPVYATYDAAHLSRDLAAFLVPAIDADVSFAGKYPADYLVGTGSGAGAGSEPGVGAGSSAPAAPTRLPVWHLVGGLDPITPEELTGAEPDDGYPVLLADWIMRDGLKCLKIKLRGNDAEWDYRRLIAVGETAIAHGADWLSADFNCTVTDPAYVNAVLDRLLTAAPRIYGMLLYVEQPFPYDLEAHRIDVRSVSARKPLFMDESAHDWRLVRLGRSLGWSGVALKTCKTQTGAILSACWAKAHGMTLMVQDLTNPMLAQIPHVQLAAHAGTIMGVESNAMQFYPEASLPEAAVHPGLYRRRDGVLDLTTLQGPGFGYRVAEIRRTLPAPAVRAGASDL